MCATCPRKEIEPPSDYFLFIHQMYLLQRAGFPFGKDDLTIEQWEDLGVLKQELEAPRGT